MKRAAIVCLTTLLGFAAAACSEAQSPAPPAPAPAPAPPAPPPPPPAPAAASAAKITAVEGDVGLVGTKIPVGQKASGEMNLKIGDQIIARSKDALVQLTCANGAAFQLSDMFDVLITKAGPDERCAISLKTGTAFGVSNPEKEGEAAKAAIDGGVVAAESGHTQFGVTVPADNPADAEAFVIEGEAIVRAHEKETTVKSGELLYAKTLVVVGVPEDKYRRLATNLARVDLQRAGAGNNKVAIQSLGASYYRALRNPGDANARKQLGEQYKAYKVPESSINRYNIRRMNQISKIGGVTDTPAPQSPGNLGVAETAGQVYVAPMAPPNAVAPMAAQFAVANGGAPKFATYPDPVVNGHRLDWCLHVAAECGGPPADAFCRQKGFTRASSFREAENIGAQSPTLVLADNKLCTTATCDGFASINCE